MWNFIHTLSKKITQWLWSAYDFQLFITLFSLPCLIWWGLGVSYMTLVGNIIFLPFLCSFLALSILHSCMSWLIGPNTSVAFFLDTIADTWKYLLSYAQPWWLTGFYWPLFFVALGLCTILLILFTYKKIYALHRTILLSCSIATLIITNHVCKPRNKIYTLHYKNRTAHLMAVHGKLYFKDDGLCKQIRNIESWIQYTLLPTCFLQFGNHTFSSIILDKQLPAWKKKKLTSLLCRYIPCKQITFA